MVTGDVCVSFLFNSNCVLDIAFLPVFFFFWFLGVFFPDLKVIGNPPLPLWKEKHKSHKEHYTQVHQLSS